MNIRSVCVGCLTLVCVLGNEVCGVEFTVIDDPSFGAAISADGSTVVGVGAVWTEDGKRLLPEVSGSSFAWDVSGDGSVIVGEGYARFNGSWPQQAVVWPEGADTSYFGLGFFPDDRGSRATGVSGDGQVVVGASFNGAAYNRPTAFRWSKTTGMVNLGTLPWGSGDSYASAVSSDGAFVAGYCVVGEGTTDSNHTFDIYEAVRWDATNGIRGLGATPDSLQGSLAYDVSGDGSIIVGEMVNYNDDTDFPGSDRLAFEWTTTEGMQPLDSGDFVISTASAISEDGSTIVGSAASAGVIADWADLPQAVIWDSERNMIKVSDILAEAGIDTDVSPILSTSDVSADGRIIIGHGYVDGDPTRYVGWVLDRGAPPSITDAHADPAILWPANNKMVAVHIRAEVEDDDSAQTTWGIVDVECNEAIRNSDVKILDDQNVMLRATRSGNGNGRVYTLWIQAIDEDGNLAQPFPVEVTVPHDRRGKSGTLRGNRANDVSDHRAMIVGNSNYFNRTKAFERTATEDIRPLGVRSRDRVNSNVRAIPEDGPMIEGEARPEIADAPDLPQAGIRGAERSVVRSSDPTAMKAVELVLEIGAPPSITDAHADPAMLWPANNKMVAVCIRAKAEDDDSAQTSWGIVDVECNESIRNSDVKIVDEQNVMLRAARSGNGNGRVYTLWIQAIDEDGNLAQPFPVEVTVPHDRRSTSRE